jgi:hypothetical protein
MKGTRVKEIEMIWKKKIFQSCAIFPTHETTNLVEVLANKVPFFVEFLHLKVCKLLNHVDMDPILVLVLVF